MNEMAQQEYDFCLLNEEDDAQVAINILQHLEQAGNPQLRGYFDDRDGEIGRSMFTNVVNAIEGSHYVLVIISPHAVSRGGWWEMKAHMALKHRLDNPHRRDTVIPIYLPGLSMDQRPLELLITEGLEYNNNPHFWTQLRRIFD